MPRTELGVATIAYAVTPSDSSNLSSPTRAIYVGSGGDINVTPLDSSAVILYNVPAGSTLFLSASKVSSTDTSASNIVAFV